MQARLLVGLGSFFLLGLGCAKAATGIGGEGGSGGSAIVVGSSSTGSFITTTTTGDQGATSGDPGATTGNPSVSGPSGSTSDATTGPSGGGGFGGFDPSSGTSGPSGNTSTTGSGQPVGNAGVGESCESDGCQAGLFCQDDFIGSGKLCEASCSSDNDCTGGGACVDSDDGQNADLCTTGCNITAGTGCPNGGSCRLDFLDTTGNGDYIAFSDCTGQGTSGQDGDCSDVSDCKPGFLCNSTEGYCAKVCTNPGGSCSGGRTCIDLEVSVGSTSYGVCDFE